MDGFPRGLAGFRPVELLGRGASGLVFRAWQQGTGQFVAIKTPHVNGTPIANARFHEDVRLRSRLSHPHIAGLIDAGHAEGGRPYVVSEWVPGQTLRRYLLRHGRLQPQLSCELMAQLLDALACVHAADIVHRDLTPQNLLVTETGARPNLKLIDFGLAARAGVAAVAGGTPGYCAPEQLRGAPPAPTADLYAWALLFVECLSGRPAIAGHDNAQRLHRQLGPAPVPLPPGLEPALAGLLRESLGGEPAGRPRSASALHERLRRVMRGPAAHGGSDAVPDSPAPARPLPPAGGQMVTQLCLSVLLTPLAPAGLDLSLLEAAQAEQQQWCLQAMAHAQGTLSRVLGDRLLIHFSDPDGEPGGGDALLRAALGLLGLREEAARRSRLLQIRHGLRLDLRAGLHVQPPSTDLPEADFNHAAAMALHLHRMAPPGAILASDGVRERLGHSLRFDVQPEGTASAGPVWALRDEPHA